MHDELDLPPGAAKLKQAAAMAVIMACATSSPRWACRIWRLRLGIGHPGNKAEVVNFVLKAAAQEEQDAIDRAIDCALDVMPAVLAGNMPEAMKRPAHPRQIARA